MAGCGQILAACREWGITREMRPAKDMNREIPMQIGCKTFNQRICYREKLGVSRQPTGAAMKPDEPSRGEQIRHKKPTRETQSNSETGQFTYRFSKKGNEWKRRKS